MITPAPRLARFVSVSFLLPVFVLGGTEAAFAKADTPFVPGEVIVKFKTTAQPDATFLKKHSFKTIKKVLPSLNGRGKAAFQKDGVDRLEVAAIADGSSVTSKIAELKNDPTVEYAEPNYILSIANTPNDPSYPQQWDLNNTGQTGGVVNADINAPEAWDNATTDSMVIGVIDTGIDYTHPDLAANVWTNPGEIPGNGIDDDGNGFVDDVHGWNFITNTNDVMDDQGHGTHVAGTIAAVGNNGVGITGINWTGKVAALKFLGSNGSGNTADAVRAVQYATMMGFKITSNSWGGGPFSQALSDAVSAANDAGDLFIVAAGNNGLDSSLQAFYPSSMHLPNMISVAATDQNDQMASFSNYGASTVDIAAPGVNIYSTVPTGTCTLCSVSGYASLNGTSMATPHVSGAAALIWSANPSLTAAQVKSRLLSYSDPIVSVLGKVSSNGRLNIGNAWADTADTTAPGAISDLSGTNVTSASVQLSWTATGDDGATGTARRYDIRYSTSPITEANFYAAAQVPGLPLPKQAGSAELFKASGFVGDTTYYLAMKVIDNRDNASPLSNQISFTTLHNTKPVANAGPDQTQLTNTFVTLDASGSYDPDGTIVSYKKDFGFGYDLYPTPITRWNFGAPGVYPYTLTVTDDGGLTATDTAVITILSTTTPIVASAGPDQTGTTGQSLTFDASASSDPDGTINSYAWNFGNGYTTVTPNAVTTESFPVAGTYTVTLTTTDIYGLTATDTAQVTIVPPAMPIANAGPDVSGYVGQGVLLDGRGSYETGGSIQKYFWYFGDGTQYFDASTTVHTYNAAGVYTVTLEAWDPQGLIGTDTATATIRVLDTTAPAVSFSAPASGATISGTTTITATASDNVGVTKVEFYKDTDATPYFTDTASPYTTAYNTRLLTNGSHTLKVIAYDAAGNKTTATRTVTVSNTVPDTTAPTVSITSPANNALVTHSTNVTIAATASDNVGVTKVEFYVNGSLKCTDTSSAYSCVWAVPAAKSVVYTLTAIAYDAAGNNKTSTAIKVTSK